MKEEGDFQKEKYKFDRAGHGRERAISNQRRVRVLKSVLRVRMDPELLPGSGSGIIVPDPDPAEMKEQIN